MLQHKIKFQSSLILIAAIVFIALLISSHLNDSAHAENLTASVIVQLRGDPAAVYKARIERSGGTFSAEQLESYRSQLRTSQDEFLSSLTVCGRSCRDESVCL